jgi:DNA polymerase-3 subunit beta
MRYRAALHEPIRAKGHSPQHYYYDWRSNQSSSDEDVEGDCVKVSCLQENLARGLSIVGRGVSTRGTLPILGNVLLKTDGGRLKLTATNLEIGVNCWVPAKIEDEGAITVPAKLFTDFVNSLPPGPIDIALNVRTKTVHLKSATTEANMKGLDAEEFPIIPAIPDKPTTRMSQGVLRRMINEVAADPYRLSVRRAPLLAKVDPKVEIIIPARSLFEVARIVDDSDAPVDILVTPNGSQVIFHTEEADLVSRIIEGQFPNYRQVIPTSHATRVTVSRDELLKATKLASYFARDAANIVRFTVDPAQEVPLVVSATAAEVGDNTSRVDATVEGPATAIAFNSRFVADALGSLGASEVALELGGPLAPGVVRIVGDDSYLHVVMPLRIPS